MKPTLVAFVLMLGLTHGAGASGPAGSTGAEAAIPGNIVQWRPGDPVPPQGGILSLIFAPQPQPQPYPAPVRQHVPKVPKQ